MDLLIEPLRFVVARKKFWLAPVLAVLSLFGGLIFLGQESAVAPFIYMDMAALN